MRSESSSPNKRSWHLFSRYTHSKLRIPPLSIPVSTGGALLTYCIELLDRKTKICEHSAFLFLRLFICVQLFNRITSPYILAFEHNTGEFKYFGHVIRVIDVCTGGSSRKFVLTRDYSSTIRLVYALIWLAKRLSRVKTNLRLLPTSANV